VPRSHPIPSPCPVCGEEPLVTRLDCDACGTRVEGRFRLGRFARLSAEQLAFLDAFVRNRGIIKDVEADLGISYPTVRARLDDVIRAMGYPAHPDLPERADAAADRRRILEALRDGRLTPEEAARRLGPD
jgi:hypothetical protein